MTTDDGRDAPDVEPKPPAIKRGPVLVPPLPPIRRTE